MDSVEKPNVVVRGLHPDSQIGRGVAIGCEALAVGAGAWALYRLRSLEQRLSKRTRVIMAGGLAAAVVGLDRATHVKKWEYRRDVRRAIDQARVDRVAPGIKGAAAANTSDFAKQANAAAATGQVRTFSGPLQRNTVVGVPQTNPRYIFKSMIDLHLINEVSCSEMARLLGFGAVVPQSEAAKVTCGSTTAHLVSAFLPGTETITDLYMAFAKQIDGGSAFQSQLAKLVSGFDLESLQLSIVFAVVMGLRDAHNGNFLVGQGGKVWAIDFEEAMPGSNDGAPRTVPFVVGGKLDIRTGQPVGRQEMVDIEMEDVASVRCAPAGLPQAKEPFTGAVRQHLLAHLSEEKLRQYHTQVNRYSNDQVQAQLERVRRIHELLASRADLSPRDIVVDLVGSHPTYKSLKEEFEPFFLFQQIGAVSSAYNSINSNLMYGYVFAHNFWAGFQATRGGKSAMQYSYLQWARGPALADVINSDVVAKLKAVQQYLVHTGASDLFS